MSRVIVTGGSGFIGTYVVELLLKKGHEVLVIDDLSKAESKVNGKAGFLQLNLSDEKKAEDAFKGYDYCINLASKIGGIGYFHKYPATILSENNKIYSSTFNAAAKNKMKRMVYISSSMVFESTDMFPSKEDDLSKIPPPVTGYGFSKLIGEYYCRKYKDEYDLDYTIIRPFNAYGINEAPGEFVGYAHVIPDLTKKILSGQYPVEILGDGKQTRCYTNVKDIAKAIVMAMDSPAALNQDFNIGTEEETSVLELAEKIWNICKMNKLFKAVHVEGFKHDIKRRVPDTRKAREILGWHPDIRFEDGLKEMVGWLRSDINL